MFRCEFKFFHRETSGYIGKADFRHQTLIDAVIVSRR